MPRIVLALCALLILGGCPGVLAPSMDPVRRRCEALSWPASQERDEALAYLHGEFAEGDFVTYKFVTDRHREELGECMRALARLLDDPDPVVRRKARQTLGGLTIHVGPRAGDGVVAAVLRDAERLWRGADLLPEEATVRADLLALDLHILSSFGPAAEPARPLVESILAGPVLPREGLETSRTRWLPPPPCAPFAEASAAPTVQDAAAQLAWHLDGSQGPHPAFE